jgi:hypothetical protein
MLFFSKMKFRETLKMHHTKLQKPISFGFTEIRNLAFALCDGNTRFPFALQNMSIVQGSNWKLSRIPIEEQAI